MIFLMIIIQTNGLKTSSECRIIEHILEGLDEDSIDIDSGDVSPNETETHINIGWTMDDDQFIIATEEQFFLCHEMLLIWLMNLHK